MMASSLARTTSVDADCSRGGTSSKVKMSGTSVAGTADRKRRHTESTQKASLYSHHELGHSHVASEVFRPFSSTTSAVEMHEGSDRGDDDAVINGVTQDVTFSARPCLASSLCRNTTKVSADVNGIDTDSCVSLLTDAYRSVLIGIGEDPNREGLLKTPERAAKAMMYFTKGSKDSVVGNV